MCHSFRISLISFAVSISILFVYYVFYVPLIFNKKNSEKARKIHKGDIAIGFYWFFVSLIQLEEALIWFDIDNNNIYGINFFVSKLIYFTVAFQLIAFDVGLIYEKKLTKIALEKNDLFYLFLKCLFVILVYLYFGPCLTIIGENNHLVWCYQYQNHMLFKSNSFLVCYFIFCIYSFSKLENKAKKIFIMIGFLLSAIYSLSNSIETGEFSSNWCYLGNMGILGIFIK
jgi:hypothetical protein